MTIDHENPCDNNIYVTCDASDWHMGATLSFRLTWESVRPVAFDFMQLKGAEKNYPVHKKELLAIIHALKKWQSDLLSTQIYVYTDHCTLENFDMQKDLSCHQLHWQEFLLQYNMTIMYIHGEDNTVADALSQLPPDCFPDKITPNNPTNTVNAVFQITSDKSLLERIRAGYAEDKFCKQVAATSMVGW
jgi:hypothetical protein